MLKNSELDIINPFKSSGISSFSIDIFRKNLIKYIQSHHNNNDSKYQVVILAAGKGSRMKIDHPKVMYELAYPGGRKSLLQNMLDGIESLKTVVDIDETFIVINNSMQNSFQEFNGKNGTKIVGLDESYIKGTAVCLKAIKNILDPQKKIILLWGDLALWRVSDLQITIKTHEILESAITFPTRLKKNPYVAFLRSINGEPSSIIHSNESNSFKGLAEQDCLKFVCDHNSLSHIDDFIDSKLESGEVDFVHLIPYLTERKYSVIPLPISDYEMVYGLNTPKRAKVIEDILKKYTKNAYNDFFMEPL
jgi:bifunctional N-acetylglucosamine-1-phosphate-uridyltransferase/glucosamine-1-phosphate-acetyltransferase GlmU-like protein